jgi:dynein heavy chain
MGELYGETNIATGEFSDGLVPTLVRKAKQDETLDKHWIIFDGPVDSLWIESMNTVLDDSKTLCLVSGERIKIPATITMLFEVQDLAQASPATVSRCGMVYIEPVHLGWTPIIDTWSTSFKQQIPTYADDIIVNIKRIIGELLPFMREECIEMVPSVDLNLVQSCLNLIGSLLREDLISSRMPEDAEKLVNLYIAFALSWSLGANIHDKSRKAFEKKFKFVMETLDVEYPDDSSIYDYCIDDELCEFVPWLKRVPEYSYDASIPYFNILVPTIDTVRYKYVLDKLVRSGHHALFTGETGVGKTVIVQNYLMNPPKD